MKKPETPKSDASAKPAETKADSSETISIDSKGNANLAKNSADQKSGTTPNAAENAKPASASNTDANSTTNTDKTKSDTKPASAKPEIKPGMSQKSASDKNVADKARPAAKKRGGSAILLFVLIIAGALVIGWLTRALWWRDAEPILNQYVPAEILSEITPEGMAESTPVAATTDEAATDSTSRSTSANNDTDTSGTSPGAPERDDAMIGNEDGLAQQPDNIPSASTGNSTGTDEGTVVVDPALTERLSRLEGTINALRERLNSERSDTLNNTVARRMAEIETRTAPIEELARVESELSGVAAEMRDLSARLSTMEEEVRATAGLRVESRGQAIAMAVTLLRDALQRGGPFMIALNQLERSGSDDPVIAEQIAALKPLADHGAPTIEKLRQSFPAMAQQAVQAASDDHSGSILAATWANIKKLIPVRRVDVAGEASLDGRLVTAEAALESDDLDAAIAALDGVEGENAKAAIAEWLEDAKSRQLLNRAIATLSAHAINLLTGDESLSAGDSQ
ncbi:uroporphyrinogen III synthase [Thalassospira xianhensis MCCC 1A02616]|uniref:Uroporphyrinogen III synthase n=1 Tax=Thalassospira xianhensis MCCC 1A02616 TaxID=1177929 RepID=A0A367UD89_9PROT|nr:uroporphyrinogen III synthase [Thalassospira xianhensis MCCC 1A02616]